MSRDNREIVQMSSVVRTISETHSFNKEELIFLNTSDVHLGKILHQRYSKVSSMPGQAKKSVKEGDILLSEIRPANGRWAMIGEDSNDFVVSTKFMVLRTNLEIALPEFVYFFLTSVETTKKLQEVAEYRSATFPQITFDQVAELELALPSLAEQRSIVDMIKSLDKKRETNQRISTTLLEIAQTLFKSWFVNFDPVRAKMAGEKLVGIDDATAALFPNSMEDSEFGPIPKGWKWGSVGDIALVVDCLHSKKPELLQEGRPYLQLDTIHDDGILRFEKTAQISEAEYQKWTSRIEVRDGDCVITNVGRVGAVSQVPGHFKGAIGRNITAIRPTDEARYKTFLATALTSSFMKMEIRTNTDSGTILEALNVRSIPKLRLPVVSAPLFEAFERLCGPMQNQRQNLHLENVRLVKMRDSLLSRLISGELQIPKEMLVS
jgi:type I restriction enzyme S subunit